MRLVIGSLALALASILVPGSRSDAGGCAQCGCPSCDITCRLVCDVKKVPQVTYCCKSEPFCVAHPCPCNQVHECEPPACECPNDCCRECCAELWLKNLFTCDDAHAACADSFHKKKLIKYVTPKEVRVYRWVAEQHCPHCGCCTECEVGASGTIVPGMSAPAVPGMPVVPAPYAPPPGGSNPPQEPAPAPGKSVNSLPSFSVPAAYHIGDESGATMRDPVFNAFYNK